VLLLEVYCLPRLKTKPSDGGVRREIERAERSLWRRKLAELIFQQARKGRFDPIDPILGIPISRPPDPDQWWFIESGAFEIIKSEVLRRPVSPTVIMPPTEDADQGTTTPQPAISGGAETEEIDGELRRPPLSEEELIALLKELGRAVGKVPSKQDCFEKVRHLDVRRKKVFAAHVKAFGTQDPGPRKSTKNLPV
jgi:hypothetical protein